MRRGPLSVVQTAAALSIGQLGPVLSSTDIEENRTSEQTFATQNGGHCGLAAAARARTTDLQHNVDGGLPLQLGHPCLQFRNGGQRSLQLGNSMIPASAFASHNHCNVSNTHSACHMCMSPHKSGPPAVLPLTNRRTWKKRTQTKTANRQLCQFRIRTNVVSNGD